MTQTGKGLLLFIIAYGCWLGLTWNVAAASLICGLIVSLLVVAVFGRIFSARASAFLSPRRYLWFLAYVPLFFFECLKANLDVAYRVCHPALPIKPGLVKVKTSLRSAGGLTALANSITLTPGTLSVDVDPEGGYLYVHWIHVSAPDMEEATQRIVGRFEKYLKEVFE